MEMLLSDVARALEAEHIGDDAAFGNVSTDTRSLQIGDLFVALQGEHFDGHDYLQQASDNGAVGAMVSRQLQLMLPMLRVEDTRLGLGQLASLWRDQFDMPVVGITGSNGKTTVKEMIAGILSQSGQVLSTQGNLNNDIGVPLTLLRMHEHHRHAVIEMGANHAGEILYLTRLAHPDVAVVTNAGAAHLEGFGSVEGVAHAKGEIFTALNLNGTAVINVDDQFAPLWRELAAPRRVMTFGLEADADVRATWSTEQGVTLMKLQTPAGEMAVRLPLVGRHNVMNALAAVAVALAVGMTKQHIVKGLESMHAVSGRLQRENGLSGMVILNDTYNANPSSLYAALEVLTQEAGPHWLVLGDMGELGGDAVDIHRECGEMARQMGVQRLYACGELSREAVLAFGDDASWFPSKDVLVSQLVQDWPGQGTLLVKGSRQMRMENIVNQLMTGGETVT